MIVSVTVSDNREDEIAAAIRSVVDYVDHVLLVDTGITDETVERAREVAGSKLLVAFHQWVDFSEARNAAIDAAKALLGAEWILIVDSDERIDFGSVDLRAALKRTASDVLLVESDSGMYPKEKIIRASSDARFFGPTHEALLGGSRELLRGVVFNELPKSDERLKKKLQRDVELLLDFTEQHPDDGRWWYYLGLSLEGLGERAYAADMFERCALLRGTGYEAAWASFKQAEQLHFLGKYRESIVAAARGMGADATFAECAWIASESAYKLELKDQAVAWARTAEAVGRFRGCGPERLWLRYPPALYELPYDVLRASLPDEAGRARADRDFQEAKAARLRAIEGVGDGDFDRLSLSRSLSSSARGELRSMLRPSTILYLCPSVRMRRILFTPPGGRLPMNPSICFHGGELWCVVRAINYTMQGRHYTIHDAYGVVRSENYLGRLSLNGDFIDPRMMADLDPSPREPSKIVGYEDIRLVSLKGRRKDVLTGSATVCDRDPDGRRLIARLHLTSKGDVARADVQPSNQPHEKNWMPLSVDGELTWIYSLDPTAILPGPLNDCSFGLEHVRGGAAISFQGGYLCVVHEVIDDAEGRIYLHRFVRLNKRFEVTAVSHAWVFFHHGIEFCSGLAAHGKKLFLSFGVEDREAWLMQMDAKDIEGLTWITP